MQLPFATDLLPPEALTAHIVPNLSHTLISVGQLCAAGCKATFDDASAAITLDDELILRGERDQSTGLYMTALPYEPDELVVPVANTLQHSCNAAMTGTTIAKRIAYLHACCFSPVISTWCGAIDAGFFNTFPDLTSASVRKYPPQSTAMAMGHLDQTRSGLNSTHPTSDQYPARDNHHHELTACVVDCAEFTGRVYSDPTAPFPAESSRHNKYILVIYDCDSNYIFAEPMPSRTGHQICLAYQRVHELLTTKGFKPVFKIMDNEASAIIKTYLTTNNVQYQLTPPEVHRRNAAERAIRTFKNHFVAGLCSTNPNFPLHLWDRLLPQALLTLNLLRASTVNPSLSAYAQLFGAYDFSKHPMAPPGTRIVVQTKTRVREPWAPHGVAGWYLGPSMEHYRCWLVYTPSTGAELASDTLAWFPHAVPMPSCTADEAAVEAAIDLINAIRSWNPSAPVPSTMTTRHATLLKLQELFSKDTYTPALPRVGIPPGTTIPSPAPRVVEPARDESPPRMDISPQPPDPTATVPTLEQPHDAPVPPLAILLAVPNPEPIRVWPTTAYHDINHNGNQRRRQAANKAKAATKAKPRRSPAIVPASIQPRVPAPPRPDRSANRYQLLADIADDSDTEADDATLLVSNPRQPRVPAPRSSQRGAKHRSRAKPATAIPEPPVAIPTTSVAPTQGRRPSRGTKVLRFDPRTHRPLSSTTPVNHNAFAVVIEKHGQLIRGPEATKWLLSTSREIGRCAQGMPGLVDGTDTFFFIHHSDKPADRTCSYNTFVCDYKEHKEEKERVRATFGNTASDYDGPVSSPTVDTTTVKIFFNSVLSDKDGLFCSIDLKNFFLNTPLSRFEYMRIPIKSIPDDVIQQYNLLPLVHNGYVMVEIRKGLYGLPQAAILAYELLVERLAVDGYHPAPNTLGLFLHETRPISFCLWVDDFGIKYNNKEDVLHLMTSLQKHYELTVDWTGSKYLGFTLEWDYTKRTLDVSMPGYISRALERFQHPMPSTPQHSPHSWTPPQYGSGAQQTDNVDTSPLLGATDIKHLQQVIGVLLYYARMVDNTMLVALGTLASQQAKGTEATMDALVHLLNYAATHPEAKIRYHASDMVLHIVSDASYLSASEARSRLGGYFFLSKNMGPDIPSADAAAPPFNAPILVNSSIIKAVLSSAAEAELGALFFNAKDGCSLRTTLIDMGYPQPATPIQADNACAVGIANDTVRQKRSKAIDMRFYWVRDRVKEKQFVVYWQKGSDNDADYFTKHHPPSHHRVKRSRYLHEQDGKSITSRATVPFPEFQSPLETFCRRDAASDSPNLVMHDIMKA